MTRLALALLVIVACAHKPPPFSAETPMGFVELPQRSPSTFDYRASTVDGVVLGVTALRHDPKADVAFWAEAVRRRLRLRHGYALLSEATLQIDGRPARQLCFGHDENGSPHLYWVTLVVTDEHLYVIEAGGSREVFEPRRKAVEAWIEGLRLVRPT